MTRIARYRVGSQTPAGTAASPVEPSRAGAVAPGGDEAGARYGVLREAEGTLYVDGIDDPFQAADPVWGGGLRTTGPSHRLDEVELLAPCRPTKILCVGRNYREHAAELGNEVPAEPMIFLKPPSAVQRPKGPIRLPAGLGRVDYEGELVLVIGRRAWRLDRSTARQALLGVTCGNDVSARALQKKDGQWGRAKGFDTFAPVGPWIALDVDPCDAELRTRVNGQERQRARTTEMAFDPLAILVYVSRIMTLEPGDLIFTGTPSGVGELFPGDVVEVEVSGVGVLQNPVVGELGAV